MYGFPRPRRCSTSVFRARVSYSFFPAAAAPYVYPEFKAPGSSQEMRCASSERKCAGKLGIMSRVKVKSPAGYADIGRDLSYRLFIIGSSYCPQDPDTPKKKKLNPPLGLWIWWWVKLIFLLILIPHDHILFFSLFWVKLKVRQWLRSYYRLLVSFGYEKIVLQNLGLKFSQALGI